jgi:hypothetical protein
VDGSWSHTSTLLLKSCLHLKSCLSTAHEVMAQHCSWSHDSTLLVKPCLNIAPEVVPQHCSWSRACTWNHGSTLLVKSCLNTSREVMPQHSSWSHASALFSFTFAQWEFDVLNVWSIIFGFCVTKNHLGKKYQYFCARFSLTDDEGGNFANLHAILIW